MRLAITLAALTLCGCAGIDVESLGTDKTKDAAARGIRYWQPAPFLFVRSDGRGGLSAEVKWLPDTTEKMSVRPYAWMASNQTELKFSDGVLTNAMSSADETAVVNASLSALGKVLTASAKGAKDAGSPTEALVPVPEIYKIIVKGDIIELRGGPAVNTDGSPAVVRATLTK